MFLKSKDINMTDKNSNDKFGSFFEIEQVPNSRGLHEFVRWLDEGSIFFSPSFQREYAWPKKKASELIESFLMNIPVPNIYMYIDGESKKRMVIDGKQRLETIRRFIKNEWKDKDGNVVGEFALDFGDDDKNTKMKKKISQDIENDNPRHGLTIDTLTLEDRTRLNDSYLNAITIRTPNTNEDKDAMSIYYIFERLNTGGVTLTPSEIRLAIWSDLKLLEDIKSLAKHDVWQKSVKTTKNDNQNYPSHEREESLLKIISLTHEYKSYKAPIKDFLTKFLDDAKKNQKNFTDSINMLTTIINDSKIQKFLTQYHAKKNIKIETFYIAVLIAKTKNINYTISNGSIFDHKSFTKQGGTAQGSVVRDRIKHVYKKITGQEL